MEIIDYNDFAKVDIRKGIIVKSEIFERAKKPAYKIWADFGNEIGILQTSAQVTVYYKPEELIGKQILGCINLGQKNIAGFISQFLLLGVPDKDGNIVLVSPDFEAPNGVKLV